MNAQTHHETVDPRPVPSFSPTPSPDVAFARVTRLAGALSLSLLVAACGVLDMSSDALDPSATADAQGAPAQTAETVAPSTGTAETVSRTGAPTTSAGNTSRTSGSTAPPAPSAPSTAGGTINTLDTIVSDMRLRNDAVLRGYESRTVGWYVGPGYTVLGNDPRMTNAPQWFKQSYPEYINGTYMRALLPWLVIFDGVDNRASNTRVHMRNMRAWILSRSTGQWRSVGLSPGVSGFNTGKATLVGGSVAENKRTNADGSVEVKPPSDPSYAWHGWWNNGRVTIDPTDIQAMLVTLQARLTVDNPAAGDDRSRAQYMIQVGADYYYDQNWTWTVGAPGVGTSRSKLVKNDWQAFNLFTFTDVGISEPGGGISEAEFRRNPPPLE